MLSAMRGAVAGWVAKIFIGVLALSFAVWGIADIFGGYGHQSVARVGDTEVSSNVFYAAYQRELRAMAERLGRRLTNDEARALGVDRRVLSQLMTQATLTNQARELKLSVSDEFLAERIAADPNFRDAFGRFDSERFNFLLASAGYSEAAYLAEQANAEARAQLTTTVTGDLAAPDVLKEAFREYQGSRRVVEYFEVPDVDPASIAAPSADDLQTFYSENEPQFTAPEFRHLYVLSLEPEDLVASIEVEQADIEAEYDDRRTQFETSERRAVDQLLFPDPEQAAEAHAKLTAGSAFKDIAVEYGFADNDTDLGFVEQSDIVDPKIAEAAFSLESGAVSEPIEGALGTAIVRVRSIEAADVRPLEEVSGIIRAELALVAAREEALDLHDAVEDERAGGKTFSEIADELGIKYLDVAAVDRTGNGLDGEPVPGLPTAPDLLRTAFESDIGIENDPIETRSEGFMWVEVVDVTDPQLKPFEEVEADVRTAWRARQAADQERATAEALAERARSGEQLESLAEELGVAVQWAEPFTRRSPDAPFGQGLVSAVFAAPVGAFLTGPASDSDRVVVTAVKDEQPPEELAEADVRLLEQQIAAAIGNDLFEQYVSGLQARDGVTINTEAVNAVFGDVPQHR